MNGLKSQKKKETKHKKEARESHIIMPKIHVM